MESDFPIRKIIHVDMDAFFASVAQLDNPDLRGRPIAVGGSSDRGVVSAASYEARKFGVRSAMSSVLAKKLCPELIFVQPHFERYKEISQKIRKIFLEYTDLVEPLSLDEAYLDVTENKKGNPSATLIAKEIRKRILEETGLHASAGISINKFIAKIASDINKPNGQKTINPEEVISFLETLSIRKFFGVGKVTQEKMYNLGIFTGKDLKEKSLDYLVETFGKSGSHYYNVVRGIHTSEVKPNRIRKSLGAERTFSKNISSEIFMMERLKDIADELERRLTKSKVAGKTVTLKIKYSDFTLQTRCKTLPYYIADKALILETVKELLFQEKTLNSVRLLGISLSNLNTDKKTTTASKQKAVAVQLKFDF
ncbi:MAG: DNA polymerase IV [Flavobacteriaceae bacterium CG_4_8_14_3_um_filter_34_10]|nr:DNA polymerase IV [Flavobacteriia bacterium]OIP50717.1 MAG: DNA polymerase IV [Flavobacteriaceae bacterium CG2_30_34_30]PIQ18128.1 MAG: DNA polymerase IV [Flavobacteriaceae bacterium CG18_big_fil_WC_8_21_14_2_50_34_36]PIV51331.1 MAG: DNA polymerase IV [Flavobacteriaceae bacterium CG02_land_8_20_14_3_00_34_13]PIX10274.1 MAG: DNA polymerase IV [Flavobacteriaceae bacterium CG_4_8_14_3_um_filter_34_10]PIZ08574.1 MAG: DNA polymerase IV [Flavobacteriaceae bacterium CG_4_10_14_0_8_um_filter_34_31]